MAPELLEFRMSREGGVRDKRTQGARSGHACGVNGVCQGCGKGQDTGAIKC